MALFVALAAGLAPANQVPLVSAPHLARARDRWLLTVLGLGSAWLAWHGEAWLGLMGLWFLCSWRSPARHASLLTWVAIGATWFLLRSMPAWAFEIIAAGWLAIGAYHVGMCVWLTRSPSPYARRPLFGLWRTKSGFGSPAITALFFALLVPFAPWWYWPVLAVGLYLTWSWLALIGVAVGLAVLEPAWAGWLALAGTLGLGTWWLSWYRGWKWLEWTPRGDSFDSVTNRLIVWVLLAQAWWCGPRWLGHGPYSVDPMLRRWSARCWIELPNGEACVDPLQHVYEYGALGGLAALAFTWRLSGGLAWGDPWTAAAATAGALAWGHYPLRHPALGLVILTIAAGVVRG